MARLQDVILRGLAADQPLATDVAPGTLYYSSDTSITERSDGATWETYSDAGGVAIHAPTHSDGGGDPVDVTDLAGYPGGTGTFLRADATFDVPTRTGSIGLLIDGAGSAISTGVKGYLEVPFNCSIISVTLLADVSGSIVIDIWKDTYINYPPVVGDSITAAAKPTISAAIKSQDVTLTGWTTAITAGDILGFNVDSAATITRVTLTLQIQAT